MEREKNRSTAERREQTVVRDCLPWRLWVPGLPVPQPRPRARAIYSRLMRKWTGQIYDPGNANQWKARVAAHTMAVRHPYGLDEPIQIQLVFAFIRPPSHLRPDGTVKPSHKDRMPGQNFGDWDNLAKAVCDALGDKGVYLNDAHICDGCAKKVWGEEEGCLIMLDALRERGHMVVENGVARLVTQETIFNAVNAAKEHKCDTPQ